MKAWIGAVALIGLMLNGEAMAISNQDTGDGNQLLKDCKTNIRLMNGSHFQQSDDGIGVGSCVGLVEGVMKTMAYLNTALEKDLRVCWPDNITNGQGIRIVVKYLEEHPKDLHKDRTLLAMFAFSQAYRCKV
ncbi:hypothetical protein CS390_18970 [Pseudomonas sp. HLS-6]|uniref:Rap1a/Tai family immunity protein n=1 Tax=Pseudomonas sp. HLS-6 TaxID=2049589 RepID=UPI000C18803F|nr:Rap1a/Tai family immunity protein [Pseudomonas sp. HLS-6]ATR84458.1 hypothetical protein CS390_18970 [Pseudomonas sp. HLS-6]